MKNNEEKEFEELAAMEEFEASEATEIGDTQATVETPKPSLVEGENAYRHFKTGQLISKESTDDDRALGLGAVEGIPFVKDALSATEAISKSGFTNFGENYKANLNEWNQAINEAEKKSPAAFMIGDVASGAILPWGKSVRAAIALGALSGGSREESRNPFEVAEAAAKGAAVTGLVTGAIGVAGKTISYVGDKLGLLGARTTKEAVGSLSVSTNKDLNRHIRKFGTSGASEEQKTLEFAQRVTKIEVDGEPLLGTFFKGQDFAKTSEKAGVARSNFSEGLNRVTKQMDDLIDAPVSGKLLYDRSRSKMGIDQMLMSKDPATVELAQAYEQRLKLQFNDVIEEISPTTIKKPSSMVDSKGDPIMIDEIVETTKRSFKPKEFTPSELQRTKIEFADTSNKTTQAFSKLDRGARESALSNDEYYSKSITSVFGDTTNEVAVKVGAKDSALGMAYKELNQGWADMNIVSKITRERADSLNEGTMGIFKRALGMRGLLVGNLLANTGGNKAAALAFGSATNMVINDPSTPYKVAVALDKSTKHIQNNPDSPFLKRIVMAAQAASSSNLVTGDPIHDAVTSVSAEISLLESPIQRTYADIENKSDSILESLQYHSPEQADTLRQAFTDGDEEAVRMIMNEASKMPELKNIFAPGKGIDGRVFSPEEKEQLREELNSMDVSLNQKLRLEDKLMKQGLIPQIQEEPERFFRMQKRDKDKPRY